MSKTLFTDFEPVSAKQWKQKIQVDLKGADYNEALVWQSLEGIHVKPTYHADDIEDEPLSIPGHPTHWNIAQEVFIDDTAIANGIALDSLSRGAEALVFVADDVFDIPKVFQNFQWNHLTLYFDLRFLDASFLREMVTFFHDKNARVYYNLDIVGHLAKTGNWFHSQKQDHDSLDKFYHDHSEENILLVDTSVYQNAGANIIQQLAYGLAHAHEYVHHFCNSSTTNDLKLTFKMATGSNYFFEIAKIRAMRLLYATLASEYGIKEDCHIQAAPSKRNKTLYDYNVNMLRTTTETMSAVLGGANTICNLPYDSVYHKSNEFGERISRNQLLILKHESYFDTVANPADGSYYIENLTLQLAETALEVFKSIEQGGGLLAQLKEGTLQKKIKESAKKEQEWFDQGKLVLVGTNKYPNETDRMKATIELFPFVKTKPRKTEIAPIIAKRIAENVEQERLSHE